MRECGSIGVRTGVAAAMFILIALAGCGSARQLPEAAAGSPPGIVTPPWPPPAGAARPVSDLDIHLLGTDYSAKSENAYEFGDTLVLPAVDEVPWGLYGVDWLSADNELRSVKVDYSWPPGQPPQGTELFIGLANYHEDRWEWFAPEQSPWWHFYITPEHYRNGAGESNLIIAVAGIEGQAVVNLLTFSVSGSAAGVPQNLSASVPEVGRIELSWDAVEDAAGYNVYRSSYPDLKNPRPLTTEPVLDAFYADESMPLGYMYYYFVTAVSVNESGPSNMAWAWAHEIELPAPQNPRVTDRGEDSFRVAWDWEDDDPDDFLVYLDDIPYFPIFYDTERFTCGGFLREALIMGRDPGRLYYWKMCARENGLRGRMSIEKTGTTGECWTWEDVEVIDFGYPPVRAIAAGDQIAVAYMRRDLLMPMSVNLAVGGAGSWDIDMPLPIDPTKIENTPRYGQFLDVAYNGDIFLVAAQDAMCGDARAAYGNPGDWTEVLVHGDGMGGGGLAPMSGLGIKAAISSTEMAVLHEDLTGDNPQVPRSTIKVHTRPMGGEWTQTVIREVDSGSVVSHDLVFRFGNLYVLTTDLWSTDLYICDRDGDWVLVNVLPQDIPRLPKHHDLEWFQGELYTPGFDFYNKLLYLLSGLGDSWSSLQITGTGQDMGHEARLAVEGPEAIMIFYGYSYGHSMYQFARYSDGWEYKPVWVPYVEPGDYENGADVVLLDGLPYFVFWDEATSEVKIARGSPPQL